MQIDVEKVKANVATQLLAIERVGTATNSVSSALNEMSLKMFNQKILGSISFFFNFAIENNKMWIVLMSSIGVVGEQNPPTELLRFELPETLETANKIEAWLVERIEPHLYDKNSVLTSGFANITAAINARLRQNLSRR